ncbi:MAG: hypothetical protein ACRDUA_20045 [Micromonosporaceae bacterium]
MTTRHGYLARIGGDEYDAVPAPDGTVRLYSVAVADGFTEVRPGRHVRSVPAADVQLRYVRTTCTWRDAPCLVIGSHGGWARLEYLGEDPAVAQQLGMDRFDTAVYQGWAPMSEVTELVEHVI